VNVMASHARIRPTSRCKPQPGALAVVYSCLGLVYCCYRSVLGGAAAECEQKRGTLVENGLGRVQRRSTTS
jgi:hypothetical protein